ncbi:MAG TPA: hypothetical protein VE907_12905 [Gammaproteobacteria bacterium]|nr:hypothetical protein [Gammaproteobacteria bacterium]
MSSKPELADPSNVFSLEGQLELAKAGVRARRAALPGMLSRRYAAALEKYARAERELARASVKWNKLRQLVRRLERELDRLDELDHE